MFSVNNTPETTYYPCEGVIAVGEIKSLLDTNGLNDSFAKIASVKRLRRYVVPFPPSLEFLPTGERMINYRHYGNNATPSVIRADAFDQDSNEYSQIFGFALFGKLELNPKTLLAKFVELVYKTGDTLSPNILVTLNDGVLRPYSNASSQTRFSAQTASDFAYFEKSPGFRLLIRWIHLAYRSCITSDSEAFDRYLIESDPPVDRGLSMPKRV